MKSLYGITISLCALASLGVAQAADYSATANTDFGPLFQTNGGQGQVMARHSEIGPS